MTVYSCALVYYWYVYTWADAFFSCLGVQAPTALLDTTALRSRVQLGKKRAPRTRPSRAARQSAALAEEEGGITENWLSRQVTTGEHQTRPAKTLIRH